MADTVLYCAVEVVIERDASFLRGAQECEADRRGIDRIGNAEWSAVTVVIIDEPLVILGTLEIGQEVAIGPTPAARFRLPGVVVLRIATSIELGIDGRTTADDLSLRIPN